MLSEDAIPLIIDANIKGMTIIWIIFKKIVPGKASHSPIIKETSFSKIPAEGAIINPTIIPKIIPIITFNHNLSLTKECKYMLKNLKGLGCNDSTG